MILVTDASNRPAQKLILKLVEKGYRVRILTRDVQLSNLARSLGVEVFEGDIRQPNTLLRACAGAEAVVSSVIAVGENFIQDVDEAGNLSLMETAQRSGVKRFVFVSAYGAARNHPVDFFRSAYWMEEYLKSCSMVYTVLRPTIFMEVWTARIGSEILNNRRVTIYGDGRNAINFVSVEDVAKFAVLALEDPRLHNQTLSIGGPQNLTWREVISVYERLLGKQAHKLYVPAWWLSLSSRLYSPFDQTKARAMAMHHDLATSNWHVDMSDLVRHYPIQLVELETTVRQEFRRS